MNKRDFSKIRHNWAKSQAEMSRLLGISVKAVQSFEQGWRQIPMHVERQLLFLLSLKQNTHESQKPCWILRKCLKEVREKCPAWEFRSGHQCWLINGTICHGKPQKDWQKKMAMCRKCEVFQRAVSF